MFGSRTSHTLVWMLLLRGIFVTTAVAHCDIFVIEPLQEVVFNTQTLSAHVENNGLMRIGTTPSFEMLTIEGDFNHKPSGTLFMKVAGLDDSKHDFIKVFGDLTMTGTINVSFVQGYAPTSGEFIPLFAVRHGSFTTFPISPPLPVVFRNIEPGLEYHLQGDLNIGGEFSLLGLRILNTVSFIPEPTSVSLVSSLIMIMGICTRSRNL